MLYLRKFDFYPYFSSSKKVKHFLDENSCPPEEGSHKIPASGVLFA
jgi:hypothetical protein